jgi:hypothetical protein
MIVYALLPLVAAGVLAIVFLRLADPSLPAKIAVVAALAASLLIWWLYPDLLVIAVLLQAGISLFVLIYLRVNPYVS